ncbi:MAG TPA: type II toxin-antitoxin system prevent-host-death family antitoxin [Thermoanaerobaculia bacterium]|nr:type II toxin-antitoxin system prevent-host-death family antitoxin [Thermoanaerobaculia bacterium]
MTIQRKGPRGRRLGEPGPADQRRYVRRRPDGRFEEVGIADLKAHLSERLARVRKGEQITVLDRATPIAKIVPFQGDPRSLRVRPPKPGAVRPSAFRPSRAIARAFQGFDPVASLLEDRDDR